MLAETIESGPLCITDLFQSVAYSRASKYLQYFKSEGYSGIRFEYVKYWRAKKGRILIEFLNDFHIEGYWTLL